jgi:tryptophan synthase alpha chain
VSPEPGTLESTLRAARDSGRKLLVPYITGGVCDGWLDLLRAAADNGADAIEVGIPFSDPVMDGPTIQQASAASLLRGSTPASILAELRGAEIGVPLVAMTYYNLVFRAGHLRFAEALREAGVSGAIVPDLCLEESVEWEAEAAAAGIETILLAAPVTPDARLAELCRRSRGFVYAVSLMGVTGERAALAASASVLAKRLKALTDKPVLLGVGVSGPEQAREGAIDADGVIVGAAVMRRVLAGEGPEGVASFVCDLRAGLDT